MDPSISTYGLIFIIYWTRMAEFQNSKVLTKIQQIQDENIIVSKSKRNEFLKSNYASLDDVWSALQPKIKELKLLVTHSVKEGILTTTVTDMDSGEFVESSLTILAEKPQEMGAAITYFKRYNLSCIFNIITDEDNDGNKPPRQNKSNGGKQPDGPNATRVKDILKNSFNLTKAKEASTRLSQLVGKQRDITNYTEEEAKEDLHILLANK